MKRFIYYIVTDVWSKLHNLMFCGNEGGWLAKKHTQKTCLYVMFSFH